MLENVKTLLGIAGSFQDTLLQGYIDEVIAFLNDAGVPEDLITPGIVSRGVIDLWNFGAGNGTLSDYFMQRATQLAIKKVSLDAIQA